MYKNTDNETQGQPQKKPSSHKNRTQSAERETIEIRQIMELLQPQIDFHKAVEEATMDDLRIYWDVRVVRGQDSAFAHVKGTSTLGALLAPNRKALAPSMIQEEIIEKISMPLTATLQTEVERLTREGLAKWAGEVGPEGETRVI